MIQLILENDDCYEWILVEEEESDLFASIDILRSFWGTKEKAKLLIDHGNILRIGSSLGKTPLSRSIKKKRVATLLENVEVEAEIQLLFREDRWIEYFSFTPQKKRKAMQKRANTIALTARVRALIALLLQKDENALTSLEVNDYILALLQKEYDEKKKNAPTVILQTVGASPNNLVLSVVHFIFLLIQNVECFYSILMFKKCFLNIFSN